MPNDGVINNQETTAVRDQHVRSAIIERLDELLNHDGHGDLHVEVRWARRGVREVIVSGGPQRRLLVRDRNVND